MKLHRYQELAVDRMLQQKHMGLFLDPGLGKTAIALRTFQALKRAGEVRQMLVVAPLRAAWATWPAEVEKWTPELRVEVLHGKGKRHLEALSQPGGLSAGVRGPNQAVDIFVINPEGLAWLTDGTRRRLLDRMDMLVVDESTKFKTFSSQRSRNLRRILARFDRRYILTGTPAPNGMMDLFGQVYLIDQGRTFGRSIGAYRRDYFVPVPRGQWMDWVLRRNADKDIQRAIAPLVLRLEAEELIDMPDLKVLPRAVELPAKARAQYDDYRLDMVLRLAGGELIAANGGALTNQLRQIANGCVYLSEDPTLGHVPQGDGEAGGRAYGLVHTAKADALKDLVDELGGKPVVVAYEFHHDLVAIRKALGDVPSLAECKGSDVHGLVTRWNRGDIPILTTSWGADPHGLNLQAGGHILIGYGLPWSLEHYDQMVRRFYRQGQESGYVQVYQLLANRSVDHTVARVLQKKDRDQADLLDALKDDNLTTDEGD